MSTVVEVVKKFLEGVPFEEPHVPATVQVRIDQRCSCDIRWARDRTNSGDRRL